MNQEIERKFTIDVQKWEKLIKPQGQIINQAYLSTDPNKTIRVRVYGEKGFITIKGKTKGVTRAEFEYEVPLNDAEELIKIYGDIKIEKTRYQIPLGQHIWEVDVFEGNNKGLVLAEIELKSEEESFDKPDWIVKEVSHDLKYFNSNLLHHPFNSWL